MALLFHKCALKSAFNAMSSPKLKRGAYSQTSKAGLAIEVGAKIWIGDSNELGLTPEQRESLQYAVYTAAMERGIDPETVLESLEAISETGKEYARKQRQRNSEKSGGNGTDGEIFSRMTLEQRKAAAEQLQKCKERYLKKNPPPKS